MSFYAKDDYFHSRSLLRSEGNRYSRRFAFHSQNWRYAAGGKSQDFFLININLMVKMNTRPLKIRENFARENFWLKISEI